MQELEDIKHELSLKAIVLGESGVGKTQLIHRCTTGDFAENIQATSQMDCAKLTINYQGKNIDLTLWDIPGKHRNNHIYDSYITGSQIVIIVINATDDRVKKISDIHTWLTRVHQHTNTMPAIVIVENKRDLPDAQPLVTPHDMLSDIQHSIFLSDSLKNNGSFNLTLLTALKPLFPAILFMLNNPVALRPYNGLLDQPMPTIRPEAELNAAKLNIRNLSESQAKMILVSIETLLIQGPLNEINKRYNIFAGGKPLTLKDGSTITVPEHVYHWLQHIVSASQFTSGHKRVLEEFYVKVNQAVVSKPFSRNATTHDFYASLIGFIEHVVTRSLLAERDYFSIRSKIDELSEEYINSILHKMLVRLEQGVTNDPNRNPYDVGFWGGKKHTLSIAHRDIKVPGHISALIHIMNNNPNESKNDKLINSLNFAYIAMYSTCSSRDQTTNCFYATLPGDFIAAIHHYHELRPALNNQ